MADDNTRIEASNKWVRNLILRGTSMQYKTLIPFDNTMSNNLITDGKINIDNFITLCHKTVFDEQSITKIVDLFTPIIKDHLKKKSNGEYNVSPFSKRYEDLFC